MGRADTLANDYAQVGGVQSVQSHPTGDSHFMSISAVSHDQMFNAVHAATPSSFTPEDDNMVTEAAVRANRNVNDVGQVLHSAYSATPSSFDHRANAVVLAGAAGGHFNASDASSAIHGAYSATPSGFSSRGNALVLAAAAMAPINANNAGTIVRNAYSATPSSFDEHANSLVMAAALLGGYENDASSAVQRAWSATSRTGVDAAREMADQLTSGRGDSQQRLHWLAKLVGA